MHASLLEPGGRARSRSPRIEKLARPAQSERREAGVRAEAERAIPAGLRAGKRARRRPAAGRLEHALFALTLGSVGWVWLSALLAEAARGL